MNMLKRATTVWLLVFFVCVMVSSVSGLYLRDSYTTNYMRMVDNQETTVRILADHIDGTFRIVQNALRNISSDISDETRLRPSNRTIFDHISDLMRRLNDDIPSVSGFSWRNIAGDTVVEDGLQANVGNALQEPYFQFFLNNPLNQLFVTAPIRTLDTDEWVFLLVIPVVDLEGRLQGTVSATIRTETIETLYQSVISKHLNSVITFSAQNGMLYGRYPHINSVMGKTFVDFGEPRTTDGVMLRDIYSRGIPITTIYVNPLDHLERMVSVRPINLWKLVVAISIPTNVIFHNWLLTSIPGILFPVMFSVAMIVAGYLLLRHERKLHDSHEQVKKIAHYDSLTGLPNRILFSERLEEVIEISNTSADISAALIYFDLDRFKEVNDSLGHQAGDELLSMVATRLRECVRDTDIIARLGGDEFALVVFPIPSKEYLTKLGERIIEEINKPFVLNGIECFVGVSLGIATCPPEDISSVELKKHADLALYHSKEHGRNRLTWYQPEMSHQVFQKRKIEVNLKEALTNGEVKTFFQPIIDMRTNQIVAAECLARWLTKDGQFIPVSEFITVAEESELIDYLTRYMIEMVCEFTQSCKIKNVRVPTISLNISARAFTREKMVSYIVDTLQRYDLPSETLSIEITESTLIDNFPRARAALEYLKSHGIKIAIDDFGTGYSSLSYLHQLDADALKIDQSFIKDIDKDHNKLKLVQGIIGIAKSLEIDVVAEGVETKQHRDILEQLGCTKGQGWFWSKAVNADTFAALLRDETKTYGN